MPEAGVLQARVRLFAVLVCEKVREFLSEKIGHREFRWFNAEEFRALVQNSVTKDATTIAALATLLEKKPRFCDH